MKCCSAHAPQPQHARFMVAATLSSVCQYVCARAHKSAPSKQVLGDMSADHERDGVAKPETQSKKSANCTKISLPLTLQTVKFVQFKVISYRIVAKFCAVPKI